LPCEYDLQSGRHDAQVEKSGMLEAANRLVQHNVAFSLYRNGSPAEQSRLLDGHQNVRTHDYQLIPNCRMFDAETLGNRYRLLRRQRDLREDIMK